MLGARAAKAEAGLAHSKLPPAARDVTQRTKSRNWPRNLKWGMACGLVASFAVASGWIMEEEYTLTSVVDAPIDEVYRLLTNVSAIAEVHPHLRGITNVLSEQHYTHGAVVEWELQTSAMWAPPWPLQFLRDVKTNERVSTVAYLEPGSSARIQNVGLKGPRGKIVPFYYLHWWDLRALDEKRTRLTDYELLKGSAIKFWLSATRATVEAHTLMQANIRAWASARPGAAKPPAPSEAAAEVS